MTGAPPRHRPPADQGELPGELAGVGGVSAGRAVGRSLDTLFRN
jgi:hypothetical protein